MKIEHNRALARPQRERFFLENAHELGAGVTLSARGFAAQDVNAVRARRRTSVNRLMLAHADLFALLFAYFVSERLFGNGLPQHGLSTGGAVFILTLPLWFLGIRASGLYSRDDEVIHHTTLEELPQLLRMATIGAWG